MVGLVEKLQQNPIEYQSEKVLTLSLIDQLHERPDGTAKRNFSEHRDKHLKSGTHYHEVPYTVWSQWDTEGTNFVPSVSPGGGGFKGPLILITERGYLLLVKSFKDDLAWQIQDSLVECYFSVREGDHYGASLEAQRHEAHLMEVFGKAVGPYFGEVNVRIDKLSTHVETLQLDVDDIKHCLSSQRKNPTQKTKTRHVEAMIARDRRRCPCCDVTELINEHGKVLPIAQWDHFELRSERTPGKVWLVCTSCNQNLRDQNFKSSHRVKFDAWQMVREQYEREKERALHPLFGEQD